MTDITRTRRRTTGRVRSLDTEDAKAPTVPQKVRDLARTMYVENKAKNAAERARSKAEKELTSELAERRDNGEAFTFSFGTKIDNKMVQLDTNLVEGSTTVVNMQLLRELVADDDVLMEIVSATKSAVEKHCGKETVARVFTTKPNGEFKAKVSVAK